MTAPPTRPADVRWPTQTLWFLCAAAVVALMAALPVTARGPVQLRESLPLSLFLAAALAYFFAAALSARVTCGVGHWAMILVVAAAIRLAMWLPAAGGGGDFERYTWGGALTADGVRVVLLVADVLAALGVAVLLRSAGRGTARVTIYLWNPLLVLETYHHLHPDILLAPLLVLLVWALIRRRAVIAGLALGGAMGVKLWPVLLLGFLLRAFRRDALRLAVSLGVLLAAVGAMAGGFIALGGDIRGVAANATRLSGAPGAYHLLDLAGYWPGRGILAALLVTMAAWLSFRARLTPRELCSRMSLLAILMLLLSPALWPWYLVAVVPLAAVGDRPSVLIWTALLALVYRVDASPGRYAPVVVIHAHAWALLVLGAWRSWRAARKHRGQNRV